MPPRPSTSKDLQGLLKALQVEPKDLEIYQLALVHRSLLNEKGGVLHSNERLEFLGDSVLGLVMAEHLYEQLPDMSEGQLAKRKSSLVSTATLADWSRRLGLGDYLQLGKGEELSGGRDKDTLLADGFEAVLGAVYLDLGLKSARKLVERLLEESSLGLGLGTDDPKSRLQEWSQKAFKRPPEYRVSSSSGPDHAKVFQVDVVVNAKVIAMGTGKNKKVAEQAGALLALGVLEGKAKKA